MKHTLTLLPATLLIGLLVSCGPVERPDNRPNIVLILADDIGYSDIGPYGGEIDTPNLDRLAESGLRFSRYYANNMCVPTRAALLTGVDATIALDAGTLRPEAITVAEILAESGYATYMTGKWHLSKDHAHDELPVQRGFQSFYGTLLGAMSFFAPSTLMRDNDNAEADFLDPDFYYTDAITDASVAYVREAAADGRPFFLHVAYNAAHWPLHAPAEAVAKYEGRYSAGWDELRVQRHERMKELGVVDPAWELSPRHPDVPAWERAPNNEWQQRRMEVYAAQIDLMDQGIGRLLDALAETGEMDNTLVLFQVDNGGCHVEYEPDRKGPFLPETTRDGRPVVPGNLPEVMPGPEDTYQSYGYGWANLSNTPFRLFKKHDHEGGILVPLIASWPERVADAGGVTDQVVHVNDVTPTLLEVAGVRHPSRYHGGPVLQLDGKSFLSVIEGEQRRAHDALFWKWSQGRAVRRGQWKLVAVDEGPWELYDIEADGTELHNLAEDHPEIVAGLERLWNAWNARTASERHKR